MDIPTEIIKAAIDEWNKDCKEAYELGFFDLSMEEWVAKKIAEHQKGQKKKSPASDLSIKLMLEELDDLARFYGDRYEFGLPLHDLDFMRHAQDMIKKLWRQ